MKRNPPPYEKSFHSESTSTPIPTTTYKNGLDHSGQIDSLLSGTLLALCVFNPNNPPMTNIVATIAQAT
jgi:hypothetical protein